MLQSKMDKRREQRRESQSAGSASDSSFSSVHAAGTTSAEKPGTSADSGACLVLLLMTQHTLHGLYAVVYSAVQYSIILYNYYTVFTVYTLYSSCTVQLA